MRASGAPPAGPTVAATVGRGTVSLGSAVHSSPPVDGPGPAKARSGA